MTRRRATCGTALVVGVCLLVGFGCDRDKDASEGEEARAKSAEPGAAMREAADEPEPTQTEDAAHGDEDSDEADAADGDAQTALLDAWKTPTLSAAPNGRVELEVSTPERIREQFGRGDRHIDYEPGDWPEPHNRLEALEALTPEGPVELELTRVKLDRRGEGTETFYLLQTEPSEALVDADLGSTFVAAPGFLDSEARVEQVESEPVDKPVATEVWRRFRDDLSGDDRSRLERAAPTAEGSDLPDDVDGYIEGYHVDFGGGYEKLVTVAVRVQTRCLTGGFLVDADGESYARVEEGINGFHCFDPLVRADRTGEKRWGVVYKFGVDTHPFEINWAGVDEDGEVKVERLETID